MLLYFHVVLLLFCFTLIWLLLQLIIGHQENVINLWFHLGDSSFELFWHRRDAIDETQTGWVCGIEGMKFKSSEKPNLQ